MSKNPNLELKEFLAPLPAWLQRVLQEDYSFSSQEEQLEWIKNQDKVFELTPEFERILRQMPRKWNDYCKRKKEALKESAQLMERMLVPKAVLGRPEKNTLAREAIKLRQRPMKYPQIAATLNKKYNVDTNTPDSIRKLIKRYHDRTKPNN